MAPWLITSMGLPVMMNTGALVRLTTTLMSPVWILAALSALTAAAVGAMTLSTRSRRRRRSRHGSAF
jgi:hypothetical protein